MKLRDASITWTPRKSVAVIHWMEKHKLECRFDVGTWELSHDQNVECLLWWYVNLTCFEDIDPDDAHQAFMKIDEYKHFTRECPFRYSKAEPFPPRLRRGENTKTSATPK